MGINNFNRRQCICALKKIGFQQVNSRRGKHDKFTPPSSVISTSSNPPFIMVPRHKNLHCQNAIIKELSDMGGDELVKKFRQHL